jgi:serine phosphatase RsbU (regulator of sigma subunit)
MAVLSVAKGPIFGRCFPLVGECSLIGRQADCDLLLNYPHISRRHAQILVVDGEYFVENLDRRGRTYVNGKLVEGRCPLRDLDQLQICDFLFTFFRNEAPPGRVVFSDEEIDVESTADLHPSEKLSSPAATSTKLEAMLRVARQVGGGLRSEETLPKILDCLFGLFPQADRALVMLREPETGILALKAIRYRDPDLATSTAISLSLIERVLLQRTAVLSRGAGGTSSRAERSLMCVPVLDSLGRAIGVLLLESLTRNRGFTQLDLEVLANVTWQVAVNVENARLHERLMQQREFEFEMHLAQEVRQKLMPLAPPALRGYDCFCHYQPGCLVGGDYYDYHELPDGRLALVLADFWGKGITAALCMAKLIGEVRFELGRCPSAAEALRHINHRLCEHDWYDRYVTMLLLMIDPARHCAALASAGHQPPLLRLAGGQVEVLGTTEVGFPLGVEAGFSYQEQSFCMEPGDLLLLYSDGLRETADSDDNIYGVDRLQRLLAGGACGAAETGRRILDDVAQFVSRRPRNDDVCLVCLARRP